MLTFLPTRLLALSPQQGPCLWPDLDLQPQSGPLPPLHATLLPGASGRGRGEGLPAAWCGAGLPALQSKSSPPAPRDFGILDTTAPSCALLVGWLLISRAQFHFSDPLPHPRTPTWGLITPVSTMSHSSSEKPSYPTLDYTLTATTRETAGQHLLCAVHSMRPFAYVLYHLRSAP